MSIAEKGHYWIWSRGRQCWTIARHDGSSSMPWAVIGQDGFFEASELFDVTEGAEPAFDLGPSIEPPPSD